MQREDVVAEGRALLQREDADSEGRTLLQREDVFSETWRMTEKWCVKETAGSGISRSLLF